ELDHDPVALAGEENFPRIGVAVGSSIHDTDVDLRTVKRLDGDGHVLVVDEELVVGSGNVVAAEVFVAANLVDGGKEGEERLQEGPEMFSGHGALLRRLKKGTRIFSDQAAAHPKGGDREKSRVPFFSSSADDAEADGVGGPIVTRDAVPHRAAD